MVESNKLAKGMKIIENMKLKQSAQRINNVTKMFMCKLENFT